MLLKLALDHLRIQALLRDCSPAPEALACLARSIQSRLGLGRSPKLLVTESSQIPFCYGLFHPVIVIPESEDLAKQSIYIYHEMAHLLRNDLGWLFVGQVARSIGWFNPLVWKAFQNLQGESELAADDVVLAHGIGAVDYANNLVEMVETFRMNSVEGSVVLAMAKPNSLRGRIARILNDSAARGRPNKAVLATSSAMTIFAVFMVLSVRLVKAQVPPAQSVKSSTAATSTGDSDVDQERIRLLGLFYEGGKLKSNQGAELEKKVAAKPDDVDDRARLLGYYTSENASKPVVNLPSHKSPQDLFLNAYMVLQEGERLVDKKDYQEATTKITDVLSRLEEIHQGFPDWEPGIITYRIRICQDELSSLKAKLAATAN